MALSEVVGMNGWMDGWMDGWIHQKNIRPRKILLGGNGVNTELNQAVLVSKLNLHDSIVNSKKRPSSWQMLICQLGCCSVWVNHPVLLLKLENLLSPTQQISHKIISNSSLCSICFIVISTSPTARSTFSVLVQKTTDAYKIHRYIKS